MKKRLENKDINILIVDDDKGVRSFIERALKSQGFNIDIAEDGYEGFEKSIKNHFHIILMDIKMPNMNGIEAIEAIRQVDPRQLIIIISAYIDSKNVQRAKEFGVYKLIEKPFEFGVLMEALESAIEYIQREENEEIMNCQL
ncbi:response regulator [bacterium]|nr:response regulator [bacterium]